MIALLLGVLAFGQGPPEVEPPWYAGRLLADVRLLSPDGGAPEESLEPLLRVREGAPLDPSEIRLDLATLFRVGEFSAVEADAQVWPVYDEGGTLRQGVLLTYIVWPAPKISRLRVTGARGVRERDVLEAARLGLGEVFYVTLEAPVVEQRVLDLLRRQGYADAQVALVTTPPIEGRVEVEIRLEEGAPVTVDRLVFTGDLPVPERTLRRWAARTGVREGAPLSTEAVTAAQHRIRDELASFGSLLRPFRGWVEARVTPAITGDGEGGTRVTFTIEPGRRLLVDVEGLSWRSRGKAREALGLDGRVRMTRGFVEAAPERMETWLQRRGYLAAEVAVTLAEPPEEDIQILRLDVDRGPFHILHRVAFDGNEAIDDETLRRVMDQASDEVIRFGRVTEPEVQAGLSAVQDRYRSIGHLEATTRLEGLHTVDRLADLDPDRAAPLGRILTRPLRPSARFVTPRVTVDEGAATLLAAVEWVGVADIETLEPLEAVRADLVGGPSSPQLLEQLSRQVIDAHRRAGFLDADARVSRERQDDGAMRAVIQVEPGMQVRLRSVVTRGMRNTRQSTVRREVGLTLGQPVTSTALGDLRRDLYDLGVFRTVTTELIGDGEARDLVITVEERSPWAFELGGGASTDQGLRAFGRASRRNLWGRAHRIELFGLAGLDWRSRGLQDWTPDLTDPEWRAAVSYIAPNFPGRAQTVVVDVLLRERFLERTWQMSRSGVGVSLDSQLDPKTRLQTGLRVEARQLEDWDPGALLPGEPWSELLADPAKGNWRLQDSVYAVLLHDRRDNPFQPTRGAFFSLLGEWTSGLDMWPDRPQVSFLKSELRVAGWIPVGGPVLRVSGEVGRAWMLGDGVLPLEDRYRLGGTGSLRGYPRDTVGPRNQVDQVDLAWPGALEPAIDHATRQRSTRWVSTGGDTRATAILELGVPLPLLGLRSFDGWSVALFADGGHVWLLDPRSRGLATSDQDPYRDLFSPLFRYGVGAGLRVSTPVGPLQVDIAANPEALRAGGARKELLRDEWREPLLRAHLSLGSL